MPLSRSQKETVVAEMKEEFASAHNAVLIDYLGLKVEEVNDLRQKIRESEGRYRVVKNTLALLALDGTPLESLREYLEGPVAIATHEESPVTLAKVLTEFAKDHNKVEIRAGVMDGQAADAAVVQEFAAMPGMDDLRAKAVFLLQSPLQRTVTLLQVVQKNLAVVLKQGAEKKADSE